MLKIIQNVTAAIQQVKKGLFLKAVNYFQYFTYSIFNKIELVQSKKGNQNYISFPPTLL